MANFGFNTGSYDPNAGFDLLPAGDYVAMLVEADIKHNKANTGQYINCKWIVTEGEFMNRTLYDAVNIIHQNSMAEKLGRQRLSAISHAVGIPDVQDTDEIIQKLCVLTVGMKRDEKYGEQNTIKKFSPYQFGLQQTPASPGSYQQTAVPKMPPQGVSQQPPANQTPPQPQINQARIQQPTQAPPQTQLNQTPTQQPAAAQPQQPMNVGGHNGQPIFNTPSSEQAAKIAV